MIKQTEYLNVTSDIEVPANSFVVLDTYDDKLNLWKVRKPRFYSENTSMVCVVRDKILAGGKGIAFWKGVHPVKLSSAANINYFKVGHLANTYTNSFEAMAATCNAGFPIVYINKTESLLHVNLDIRQSTVAVTLDGSGPDTNGYYGAVDYSATTDTTAFRYKVKFTGVAGSLPTQFNVGIFVGVVVGINSDGSVSLNVMPSVPFVFYIE
jgi:hypothetical protein